MDYQEEEQELQPASALADKARCRPSVAAMAKKQSRANLYQSVAILNLVYLSCGTTFAWSSPVLGKLRVTESEGTSVASMLSLGSIVGPLASGVLSDALGRKYTVGLGMSLLTASWLLLTFANHDFIILSTGRFVAGVTCGITMSALPMYVAEISENSIRGFLGTLNQISICLGGLLVYSVGPFVSYATLHYILLGICVVFASLFPLLPDSPYSLVTKGDVKRAKDTLTWLRVNRSPVLIEKELEDIQDTIHQSKSEKSSIKELFTQANNRKAFFICCGLVVLQQTSGVSVIFFYTEKIFSMTKTELPSSLCAIVTAVISTASAFLCPVAVKYFGYKKPLLYSACGMAIGMGGVGLFFLLQTKQVALNWLPLISLAVFILFFNIGFANIPWALSGELFTNNIKPQATALCSIMCGLFAFLTTFLFSNLVDLIGIDYVFFSFSFFCCLAIAFTVILVQDTSGLSFSEIQQILNGASSKQIRMNHRTFRVKENGIEDCKL